MKSSSLASSSLCNTPPHRAAFCCLVQLSHNREALLRRLTVLVYGLLVFGVRVLLHGLLQLLRFGGNEQGGAWGKEVRGGEHGKSMGKDGERGGKGGARRSVLRESPTYVWQAAMRRGRLAGIWPVECVAAAWRLSAQWVWLGCCAPPLTVAAPLQLTCMHAGMNDQACSMGATREEAVCLCQSVHAVCASIYLI